MSENVQKQRCGTLRRPGGDGTAEAEAKWGRHHCQVRDVMLLALSIGDDFFLRMKVK
jgi:hypothetical protein